MTTLRSPAVCAAVSATATLDCADWGRAWVFCTNALGEDAGASSPVIAAPARPQPTTHTRRAMRVMPAEHIYRAPPTGTNVQESQCYDIEWYAAKRKSIP